MLIGCGVASWNLLSPILIPFFYLLRRFINGVTLENIDSFPFFFTLIMFFGEFLGGAFFQCLSLCLNKTYDLSELKKRKKKDKLNEHQQISRVTRSERRTRQMVYLLIFLIAILDCLSVTSEAFLSPLENGDNINYVSKLFVLITTYALSALLIHTPYYKHHLYSLILIVIGFILGVIQLFSPIRKANYFIAYCGAGIVNVLGISFYFIAHKYIMEKEMLEPFQVILYQGIFGSIISFVLMALLNIPCYSVSEWCKFTFMSENVFDSFPRFFSDWGNGLLMMTSIACSGLINVLYITTSKLYSPAHEAVSHCICFIFTNLAFLMTKEQYAFFITGDIILIVGSAFFFEFVVLNWRNFSENTQKQIISRGIHDKMMSLQEINDISIVLD